MLAHRFPRLSAEPTLFLPVGNVRQRAYDQERAQLFPARHRTLCN